MFETDGAINFERRMNQKLMRAAVMMSIHKATKRPSILKTMVPRFLSV